jgi:hypothetical protein
MAARISDIGGAPAIVAISLVIVVQHRVTAASKALDDGIVRVSW